MENIDICQTASDVTIALKMKKNVFLRLDDSGSKAMNLIETQSCAVLEMCSCARDRRSLLSKAFVWTDVIIKRSTQVDFIIGF